MVPHDPALAAVVADELAVPEAAAEPLALELVLDELELLPHAASANTAASATNTTTSLFIARSPSLPRRNGGEMHYTQIEFAVQHALMYPIPSREAPVPAAAGL
jgi:hypothetical protein